MILKNKLATLTKTIKGTKALKPFPVMNYSFGINHKDTNLYETMEEEYMDKPEEEAAEANPIRFFYKDDIIQEITEIKRMMKLMENDPKFYNIKGLYPEIVEDFNVNSLPESKTKYLGESNKLVDIKLDHLSVDEAVDIIYEMNKNKF